MIKPILAIGKILAHNISYDGKEIPVVKRSYPYDKTPCITIDDSGGASTLSKHITTQNQQLPAEHPQHDDEVHAQQVLLDKRQITLNINLWCNTEQERENILKQITDLFYKAQSDYYGFCRQYDNGECLTLHESCKAINNTGKRGIKRQCPSPIKYKYSNIFTTYNIIRSTFNVEPPFTLDDLTTEEITLRSIIKVNMAYYDYYTIGGNIIRDFDFKEEI